MPSQETCPNFTPPERPQGPPDTAKLVLVVEDEPDMARILSFNLERNGFRVQVAAEAGAAVPWVESHEPDLVLLDLRLPDGSGLDVLRRIRAFPGTRQTPVIVVSALGDEDTVVEALNLGADDYVVKPFRTGELLARTRRLLARTEEIAGATPAAGRLRRGTVTLDFSTRTVTVQGQPVELTRTEFDILADLMAVPERVRTRRQLCREAMGAGDSVQERTVDAHIRTIRRKLGDAGACLVTVWGVGYKYSLSSE